MSDLDDARRFFLAQDLIIPILEERKISITQKMTSDFREGRHEQVHNIAQLTVLTDLIGLITRKSLLYEQLINEEKHKE